MKKTTAESCTQATHPQGLHVKELSQEQAAQQRPIIINFCTPGAKYSNKFMGCWTTLLNWARTTNLQFNLINATGSNIHHVREALLEGDINGNSNQKPFNGKPYDYILFCDSDQLFTPQDVHLLLTAQKDVISGAIRMMDGSFAQGWYHPDYFARMKCTYRLVDFQLDCFDEPFRITLLGCGFTLVKYGVLERLDFPWFKSIPYPAPMVGYFGEDMSMFTRLIQMGVQCWLHPKVRIGHEKEVIL